MNAFSALFYVFGFTCFAFGLLTLAYYPLALLFELRRRKASDSKTSASSVSVVVPGYNEEKVIGHCIDSILASRHAGIEIILVDDGSTDGTLETMRRYTDRPNVMVIAKPNGGKASALNAGLARAKGDFVLFVDADGIFTPDTITRLLEPFEDGRVGAVCGNDSPVNLDRLLTRLANLQTHVSTGFARRALSMINCLPVVSGNIGAFRRSVLDRTGPFREGFIGEDIELTWRVYQAGYKVAFQPRAGVFAEVPSSLGGLWRQRVRWARGLLQTARIHRRMFFNPRYGAFGFYLAFNLLSMILIPILQLASIVLLPILAGLNASPISLDALGLIGWLGLGLAFIATLFSVALDGAWADLRYLYVVPLWIPYSLMMDAVAIWALALELRGARAEWNKVERTGVISKGGSS